MRSGLLDPKIFGTADNADAAPIPADKTLESGNWEI
jgi:hypothetical protein